MKATVGIWGSVKQMKYEDYQTNIENTIKLFGQAPRPLPYFRGGCNAGNSMDPRTNRVKS